MVCNDATDSKKRHLVILHKRTCGWGGIRTPGGLSPTAVFKTAALDHSATHPKPHISLDYRRFLCVLRSCLPFSVHPFVHPQANSGFLPGCGWVVQREYRIVGRCSHGEDQDYQAGEAA